MVTSPLHHIFLKQCFIGKCLKKLFGHFYFWGLTLKFPVFSSLLSPNPLFCFCWLLYWLIAYLYLHFLLVLCFCFKLVMILGVLLARKRYPLIKYLCVMLIVCGVALFMYKEVRNLYSNWMYELHFVKALTSKLSYTRTVK